MISQVGERTKEHIERYNRKYKDVIRAIYNCGGYWSYEHFYRFFGNEATGYRMIKRLDDAKIITTASYHSEKAGRTKKKYALLRRSVLEYYAGDKRAKELSKHPTHRIILSSFYRAEFFLDKNRFLLKTDKWLSDYTSKYTEEFNINLNFKNSDLNVYGLHVDVDPADFNKIPFVFFDFDYQLDKYRSLLSRITKIFSAFWVHGFLVVLCSNSYRKDSLLRLFKKIEQLNKNPKTKTRYITQWRSWNPDNSDVRKLNVQVVNMNMDRFLRGSFGEEKFIKPHEAKKLLSIKDRLEEIAGIKND